MALDYVRGIVRPDGRVCVEYQRTGDAEPKQALSPEGEDLSGLSDKKMAKSLKGLHADFEDEDFEKKLRIERSWYEGARKETS